MTCKRCEDIHIAQKAGKTHEPCKCDCHNDYIGSWISPTTITGTVLYNTTVTGDTNWFTFTDSSAGATTATYSDDIDSNTVFDFSGNTLNITTSFDAIDTGDLAVCTCGISDVEVHARDCPVHNTNKQEED